METNTTIDCSALASRTNFASYITSIRNATGNDLSLASQCRASICNGLWGSGNPDISGIGMIIGYIVQNVLGFFFPVLIILLRRRQESQIVQRYTDLLTHGVTSFWDSAFFLTFSIQIASIVVLARTNFGISANGMGDSTVRINWAVSLLTMLPLMYIIFIPSLLQGIKCNKAKTASNRHSESQQRENLRTLLFVLCWVLSVYPFLSKMIGYFGQSEISDRAGAVITNEEWSTIEGICLAGVSPISNAETTAMKVFGVGGSLFLCLFAVIKLVYLAMEKQHADSRVFELLHESLSGQGHQQVVMVVFLLVIVPILAISQVWTVLRLQHYQSEISNAAGNTDSDAQWTFGQVVAVTVFLPVLVECWFGWVNDRPKETSEMEDKERLESSVH